MEHCLHRAWEIHFSETQTHPQTLTSGICGMHPPWLSTTGWLAFPVLILSGPVFQGGVPGWGSWLGCLLHICGLGFPACVHGPTGIPGW